MRNKAFTLVELVIVIAILGILSAISFMSYVGYAENSRDSARISNLTRLEKSLEARKAKAGEYPIPDESSDVTYLGKKIFTQGILGGKTKKHLKFNSEGMDPKYETDYTYSITADGERFEIGTIMESGENNTLGLFPKTYAKSEDVAMNHGNFNGKYYSTKINGETHIFTIPSITLRNKSGFAVVVDQATENFSVTGEGALPESYIGKSEADTAVSFTPRLLYRGPNCGVETDQEIVNFIATLRDSFNSEPFLSDNSYKGVFSDYEYLRNNIDDFETLEEIGIKINESLGCHIKNFKTTDIFPTQCGYEQLNFEGVVDGFNIETQSCLFTYSGNGNAIVRDNVGVGNTKGLHVGGLGSKESGTFKYRVFSYKPFKFSFDSKTNLANNSQFKFTINGIEYLNLKGNGTNFNGGFETYTTPLLKPGLYDFEFKAYRYNLFAGEAWLDNLKFNCVGGGGSCGWNGGGFELGPKNPWDLFSFEGNVQSTWIQTMSDVTEGTYALTNPKIDVEHGYADLVLNKTFDEPQKLSFDLKSNLNSWSNVVFFINDIEYKFYSGNGSSDQIHESNQGNTNSGHKEFMTPLLPAGDYEFRWRVHQRYWNTAYLTIDNIQYFCIGGIGIGCGWSEDNLDEGDKLPWEIFDFTGEVNIPWKQVSGDGNVKAGEPEGSTAIKNPTIPGAYGKANLILNKTFDKPQKMSFDLQTELMYWSNVTFYINGIEYMFYSGNGYSDNIHESNQGNLNGNYETYSTPMLPAGDYEFKWVVNKRYSVQAYTWIDNITYSCIDGIGTNCGLEEGTLEKGSVMPWDIFKFTGDVNTPWNQKTGDINTNGALSDYSLKNPTIPGSTGYANLILDKNFAVPQKIKFDIKTELMQWSNVSFLINDIEYLFYSGNGNTDQKRESGHGNANSGFKTFESPLLPAGNYEFKWIVHKRYGVQAYITLDNIEFICQGGGTDCGWDNLTFEPNNSDPINANNVFGGSVVTPWRHVSGINNVTEGLYAIKSPTIPTSSIASMTKTITIGTDQKFNFDIRREITNSSNAKFYINNVLHSTFSGTSGYETVITNTLPAGTYTFRWDVYRYNSYISYIWLDNLFFSN